MTRAILFDAVGTLIYPEPSVAEAYHGVGRELGSSRTLSQIKELFRIAYRRSESFFALPGDGNGLERLPTSDERERQRWRQVVGEVLADLPSAAADEALARLWQHFAEPRHWRIFDDVPAVWDQLSRRGYVLGVASNFDSRLEQICRELPPLDGCLHLFISSRVGYPKPSPRFFRAVLEALHLRPHEILLVGDDPTNDVLGAMRCGWQTQLLCRRGELPAGAIRSLSELSAKLTG
jgi:putative hydrolase of the HAD superfamily